jgi:hypothetical protein
MTTFLISSPFLLMLSSLVLVTLVFTGTQGSLRVLTGFFFLAICPGLAIVKPLKLNDRVMEWVLIPSVSLATCTLSAALLLYSGIWSPKLLLAILVSFCLASGVYQTMTAQLRKEGQYDSNGQ